MNNMECHKRNCASCQQRQPIGNKHPFISSDPARTDLYRRIEARVQQRTTQVHTSDYIAGILAACWPIPGFVADEFQRQRVDRKTLEKVSIHEGTIVWVNAHRFEFAQLCRSCGSGEGEPAFVIPIRDLEGRLVDLAAWNPVVKRLGTWLGFGWALGQCSVLRPRLSKGLPVHRTPLKWMEAGGSGIVILNARLARSYLIDAGPLIAEDQKHRRELAAELAQPLPRILVVSAATASKEG
jgi:hypothetical protein